MKCMVQDLLGGGYWDKKSTDKKMVDILANICFEVLDPYALFVCRTGLKEPEFNILTDCVFNKIGEAVKQANKSKTHDDFCDAIFEPVTYVQVLMKALSKRMPFLDATEDDPKLLVATIISSEEIYNRFYNKKKRRLKRRKNVRAKK